MRTSLLMVWTYRVYQGLYSRWELLLPEYLPSSSTFSTCYLFSPSPFFNMRTTRGQPDGEIWPAAGPLLCESLPNTIEEQLYAPTLSSEEEFHFKGCEDHFNKIPLRWWEHMKWLQRGARNHDRALETRCAATLKCGYRCGRPFVRKTLRDPQWYCDGHDLLLKGHFRILELPGEIRNKIYKHALLHSRKKNGLFGANKQIREEVTSLMYSMKPLRLRYDMGLLSIDYHSRSWYGQYYFRKGWWKSSDTSLLQLFGKKEFEYVKDIEIFVDIRDLWPCRQHLMDFIDALCNKRRNPLRRLTMELRPLTKELDEAQLSHFLEAFKKIPGFKDIRFEADKSDLLREGWEKGLQSAYTIRDSHVRG
jgi:hypothetical protein